jgi:hypothetical protein
MFHPKRQRLNEFRVLFEQEEESSGPPYTAPPERTLEVPEVSDSLSEKEGSVDLKIDRYLMQYEKESVPLEDQEKEKAPPNKLSPLTERNRSLYSILFEQDAPAADAGGGDAADAGGDAGGGETPEPGAEAPVAPVPKINIRKFAEGVARLVNNYQTLIDPKTIILNRAMYYISKNYSPRLAKEMMSILERDFDLTPKTKSEVQAEYPPAPRQANAGPDSGGGVPSGGGK